MYKAEYLTSAELYDKLAKLLKMNIVFSENIKDPYFCIYGKSHIIAIKVNRTWYINADNWGVKDTTILKEFGSITPSSYALKEFKQSLRESRYYYPSLWPQLTPQINRILKSGYNSGLLYAKPGFYNQTVYHYDLNSAYAEAFMKAEVPVGVPTIHKGYLPVDDDHLNVYCMDLNVEYISHDVFPYLVNSGNNYKLPSQIISSTGAQSLYKVITQTEFEDLKKDYDVVYDCIYTIRFKKGPKGLFNNFVNRFFELKNKSEGDMRTIYKSVLASLAGKLAQGIEQQNIPIGVNEFGNIKYKTIKIPKDEVQYINPAVSIFIVDYVRKKMRDTIRPHGYKDIVLVDTDGFISLKPLPLPLSKKLGEWKCTEYENLIVNGTRSYFYTQNGEFHSSISGLGDIYEDGLNTYTYESLYELYKLKPIVPIVKKVMYCGKEKYVTLNIRLGGK